MTIFELKNQPLDVVCKEVKEAVEASLSFLSDNEMRMRVRGKGPEMIRIISEFAEQTFKDMLIEGVREERPMR